MAFGIPGDLKDLDHGLDTWAETIESMEERALEAELERRFAREEDLEDTPDSEDGEHVEASDEERNE